MIRWVTIILLLVRANSLFAQQADQMDRVIKQAFEIKRLQEDLDSAEVKIKMLSIANIRLYDTLKNTRSELASLVKFKLQKREYEDKLLLKADSITLLKTAIIKKDSIIQEEKDKCQQSVTREKQKGRQEVFSLISEPYLKKSFDELISISSINTIDRDLKYIQEIPGVRDLRSDLGIYFRAKELLDKRLDTTAVDTLRARLKRIKRESRKLGELMEVVSNYKLVNNGLKEIIIRIDSIDNKENVIGQPKEVQQMKQNKVFIQISSYIFNYDFRFEEYPYLAKVILELMNRKKPNPDAEVEDLLDRL
jgi:hypothetical protein